jgi:hypothetical protein
MKFLVITQDLRVSGTSAGIGRRSFLAKLKRVYSNSIIDVLYISHFDSSNDDLDSLPVDSIIRRQVNTRIPFHIKWINRFSSRFYNFLYAENYIYKKYSKCIEQIDHTNYDHIFIWSSGIKHETILATYGLSILKKAIIIFHDPYPHAWYKGKSSNIHKNEFLRLERMIGVVQQSKICCATAYYMAKDLQYLYASDKNFYTLTHYYDSNAFDLEMKGKIRKKEAKIQISYHGALMLGRNIINVLEAYTQLIKQNPVIKDHTEFVLRLKGEKIDEIKKRFNVNRNIQILDTLDFSNSANEQILESDIIVILENGPHYSNIMPGKVPFVASMTKPVLVVSPERSELRRIIKDKDKYIANMNNVEEIKLRLENLILSNLQNRETVYPFGDYFSDKNFHNQLEAILNNLY